MRTIAIMVFTLIFAVALEANTAAAQRIVTDGLISKGLIDEVSIYSRALSINEIEQNVVALGIAVEPVSRILAVTWGQMKVLD